MQKGIKRLILTGVLAGMSFVLFLFPKFPLIALFPWLEIDFSDVPALYASVAVSPLAGLAVAVIKNVLHLTMTTTAGIGELSNFLINGTFTVSVGVLCHTLFARRKESTRLLASLAVGMVMQLVAAVLVNCFIMIPLYSAFVNFSELGGAQYYLLAGVLPFNLVKDILSAAAFLAVYRLLAGKMASSFHK